MIRLLTLTLLVFLFACGAETQTTTGTAVGEALGGADSEGFARADRPRAFEFPADHGPHPDFRNEWWYFTGNLLDPNQRRYGFQLTLFRIALAPTVEQRASDWALRDVYMGHFAVTDASNGRFLAYERFARGAANLAGARSDPYVVWLEDWRIQHDEEADVPWHIEAREGDAALQLALRPLRPVVLQGEAGLSQKSSASGNASYYYSYPRLAVQGSLSLDGEERPVSGSAWLDREWSTSALGDDQQGWDWFALQLGDGTELMYYQMRLKDGSADPHSSGTLVTQHGTQRLAREDVQLRVTEYWQSPRGGSYPAGWQLTVEDRLSVDIAPVVADQELDLTVRYWEGAVDVTGTHDGKPVRGWGYVELTGYAR